ncbi:TPA: serine/threonine protein kinase, CMGC, CDC2/CDK subfamily [Trebouxia sp. C0005]
MKIRRKFWAFERKENGFAKTEIAVVSAFWQQKRLQRFLEPSDKAVQELNKEKLLLDSTCRHWGYTSAPEEPAEYSEGATEGQKQNLQEYVIAAQGLWSKVQGRIHAREHMLKVLAIQLWNQLGVLQETQDRCPQEVELDAADTDFLAAILDVIEAYGQSQKELMGIVVGDANKKRRDAQDQVDEVNKKWHDAQNTCNDYKSKLEHAESTNATHAKEIACLQAYNQSTQQSREDAECRAAATLEEKNRLLGQVFDLEQQKKQLQEDKQHLQEDKEHLQEGVNDTAKCIKEMRAQVFSLQADKTQLQEEKGQLQENLRHTAACKKVTAVTTASPEAPSPMDSASSAPGPTSGAELQVPSVPSRSKLAADAGTQSPMPTSDIAAAPKLTKSQKKKAKKQQKSAVQLTESSLDVPSAMDAASSAPGPTLGAELQANNLHQLKDVATSDAVLHNTEVASLKEELKVVKLSVSASEARNAELQTKLESALAEVAAVKANGKPPKVYNINVNGSSTFVPGPSHASSNLHTPADLAPTQAAPSELDQGPVQKLQKQVPGVQQDGEAVAVAKETCDAQLKKKDDEIQLLKKRFAIPTYRKRRGCIYGESIGKGRNGFLRPVGNPDVPNTVQKQGTPSELEHEAEIMHELRHPNVVQSFGLILAKGPDGPKTQCLVLEHMKCSLEDIMKTRRLTVQEMVIGFYQLTSGLNHTHVRQIVDQDIHRGNVLISKGDGSWKKGDLGSAARCKRDDGEWNYIHPKDCRVAFGCESPDLAAMLIDRKHYVPLPAFDMFALGLLMLEVVGGQRPDDHCAVLRDLVYVSEVQKGVRDPVGLPGQQLHMEYLAQHVEDNASYVKKIKLPAPGVDSPALEEVEKAPYQALLKVMTDCLATRREERPAACRVASALFKAAHDAKWL